MNYLESYNASEGYFAIQDRHGADDLLLMLDYGIFFEFLPLEEVGSEQPTHQIAARGGAGKQYAIVISTNAGLWRYMPGDTVRFTSVKPLPDPGERPHAQLHQCLRRRADRGERRPRDRDRGPRPVRGERIHRRAHVHGPDDARGGHEWVIEFERPRRTSSSSPPCWTTPCERSTATTTPSAAPAMVLA
jgi:hypothetical protein